MYVHTYISNFIYRLVLCDYRAYKIIEIILCKKNIKRVSDDVIFQTSRVSDDVIFPLPVK